MFIIFPYDLFISVEFVLMLFISLLILLIWFLPFVSSSVWLEVLLIFLYFPVFLFCHSLISILILLSFTDYYRLICSSFYILKMKAEVIFDLNPFFLHNINAWFYKFHPSSTAFGEGNGTPLQYSCLENPMDGGAWWTAVHGVIKSQTQLRGFTFTFHSHALEKEMAAHSSVLAWRIPGTGSLVGHPWGCTELDTTEVT